MFSIEYKVTISDINYGGHMGNERPLIIFQQARIELFKNFELSELNIGDGVGTIQKESHVNYLKESFLGDILKVIIEKIEFTKTTMNFYYNIFNQKDELIVTGSTLIIGYNYEKRKISKIPAGFIEKISMLEGK
nr:thioesterase family protein [uncultured Cetobacterium sp.]